MHARVADYLSDHGCGRAPRAAFGARDRLRQRTLHLAIKLARANESG